MKGKRCRCGFATLTDKARCPRCGKITRETEWAGLGTVLASVRLDEVPKACEGPMDLALIEVDGKGPKIACWSTDRLKAGERVAVDVGAGICTCRRNEQTA